MYILYHVDIQIPLKHFEVLPNRYPTAVDAVDYDRFFEYLYFTTECDSKRLARASWLPGFRNSNGYPIYSRGSFNSLDIVLTQFLLSEVTGSNKSKMAPSQNRMHTTNLTCRLCIIEIATATPSNSFEVAQIAEHRPCCQCCSNRK